MNTALLLSDESEPKYIPPARPEALMSEPLKAALQAGDTPRVAMCNSRINSKDGIVTFAKYPTEAIGKPCTENQIQTN